MSTTGVKRVSGSGAGVAKGLWALQVFIGVGAVGGGLALVSEPTGAILKMPIEMLENSPFSTYLFPGIVLFLFNGMGSLGGAWASFKRYRFAGEIAMGLGVFLVAWIALQVYWIAAFHWVHALYLCMGLLEFILGWLLRSSLRTRDNPSAA
jgi:hypothetical protein